MAARATLSIFKFSDAYILEDHDIQFEELKKNSEYYLKITLDRVLEKLKNKLDQKRATYDTFENNNIYTITFTTSNEPIWNHFVYNLIGGKTAHDDFEIIDNITSSYISFIIYEHAIYIITGGSGSRYIQDYKDGYFGVNLIPNIIKENDARIKSLENINFNGNRQSSSYINKEPTRVIDELNMTQIFKDISLTIPLGELNSILGITLNENENPQKLIRLQNTDSFQLKRSISLDELLQVVKNIHTLFYSDNTNYILNYFIPAKKRNITNSLLEDCLVHHLLDENSESFIISGDQYYEYIIGSDNYTLQNEDREIMLESENPITMEDCYRVFKNESIRLSPTFLKKFLKKWTISSTKNDGSDSLYRTSIIKLLNGHLDYEYKQNKDGIPIINTAYLMGGEWFIINDRYIETMNSEFESFYDSNIESIQDFFFLNQVQNIDKHKNETDYNKHFIKNFSNIIVTDEALIDNVEFADFLIWDNHNLYFMCNKTNFNSTGVRDLSNQMLASATLLPLFLSNDKNEKLKTFYSKIKKKNYTESDIPISFEDFITLFDKNIIYVAGYLKGFKRNTRSTYGKFLTIAMKKGFKQDFNYDYYVIGDLISGKKNKDTPV